MKKVLLSTLMISVIMFGCGSSKNESISLKAQNAAEAYEGVTIKTKHAKGMGENQTIDSVYTVENKKYLEVDLSELSDETKGYIARKTLVSTTAGEPFEFKFFEIVSADKEPLYFENSTEFLNYMDSKGYAMKDQSKREFVTEYTFESKQ